MKCPICGNENLDSTKFCIWCGAPLDEVQPAPSAEPAPAPTPAPAPAPAPSPIPTAIPQENKQASYTSVNSAIPKENSYGSSSFGGSQVPIQATYAGSSSTNLTTNVLCIIGFIISLVSILCCGVTAIFGLVLSILGLVFAAKNNQKGKGMAIAGIVISAILLLFLIVSVATGHFTVRTTFRGLNKKLDTPEKIEEYIKDNKWIDIEDDSYLVFVTGKTFKYYQNFEELDDYYFDGKYELYVGEDAMEYVVDDLEDYGITEEEVNELADRDKLYKVENLVVLVLHNQKRFVDGENTMEDTVITPYIGFFVTNNKEHALDLMNMNAMEYYLFVPEDEYEDAKKAQ